MYIDGLNGERVVIFLSRGRLNLVLFFCLVNFNDCKFDKCVFIDDRLLSAN